MSRTKSLRSKEFSPGSLKNNKLNYIDKVNYMKNTFSIALILLCLSTSAQTLKLGDRAPSLNPYEWIKGKPIKEFEKGKVYVVEFGATWCKPCIAAIPGLSRLQEKYNGQVEVISVFVKEINREPLSTINPEYVAKVKDFVAKQGANMSYTVAIDDPIKTIEKAWIEAFGAGGGIPQTFVLDKEGRIATHFKGVAEEALDERLKSIVEDKFNLEEALKIQNNQSTSTVRFDAYKPLFVDGNGGKGNDFIFRSILTKAKENVRGRPPSVVYGYGYARAPMAHEKLKDFVSSVQAVNATLGQLYYLAYADTITNSPDIRHPFSREYIDYKNPYWNWKKSYNNYWHEPILEVTDTKPFLPSNKWNYALHVPDSLSSAANLQQYMRQDLDRYFGYNVALETREMPCWFLKAYPRLKEKMRPTRKPGYKSETRRILQDGDTIIMKINGDIRDLVYQLHSLNKDESPIIERTGINSGIDWIVPPTWREVVINRDWEGYLGLLHDLGLYLERGTKPMKVVVIRDAKSKNKL